MLCTRLLQYHYWVLGLRWPILMKMNVLFNASQFMLHTFYVFKSFSFYWHFFKVILSLKFTEHPPPPTSKNNSLYCEGIIIHLSVTFSEREKLTSLLITNQTVFVLATFALLICTLPWTKLQNYHYKYVKHARHDMDLTVFNLTNVNI